MHEPCLGAFMNFVLAAWQLADIWSCGIILYAMLFGRYPFNARERDYAKKIVKAEYVLPSDIPVSRECADLLTRVLVAKPSERLPMDAIKMHPWFIQDLPKDALFMNEFYLRAPQYLDMVPPAFPLLCLNPCVCRVPCRMGSSITCTRLLMI